MEDKANTGRKWIEERSPSSISSRPLPPHPVSSRPFLRRADLCSRSLVTGLSHVVEFREQNHEVAPQVNILFYVTSCVCVTSCSFPSNRILQFLPGSTQTGPTMSTNNHHSLPKRPSFGHEQQGLFSSRMATLPREVSPEKTSQYVKVEYPNGVIIHDTRNQGRIPK